jgi:hypothetical protein
LLSSGHVKGGDVGVGSPDDKVDVWEPPDDVEVAGVGDPGEEPPVLVASAVSVVVVILGAAVVVRVVVVVVRLNSESVVVLQQMSAET